MKVLTNKLLSSVVFLAFLFASTPARVFASDAPPQDAPPQVPPETQSVPETALDTSAVPEKSGNSDESKGSADTNTGGSPETPPNNEPGHEPSPSSAPSGETNGALENESGGETGTETGTTETSISIENENLASVSNDAINTANTGDNVVVAEEGEANGKEAGDKATVATGDSLAAVTVVNKLNSNILNSQGLILFLQNILGSNNLTLDLREHGFLFGGNAALPCDSLVCGDGTELRIVNSNDVHIINAIEVNANTGNNTASGTSAEIQTGNAYASANILNLANVNITDSRYLFLFFDSFGNYSGDIVLPSQAALERFFQSGARSSSASTSVTNDNTAAIVNNVTVSADTGGNMAQGQGATVVTGDASSGAGVFNKINTNIFGSGNFSVIFRVHGDWRGGVFSVPNGVSHTQSGPGLFSFTGTGASHGLGSLASQSLTIHNTNNARIENNIIVAALTGGNTALGEDGALISTGNAYASASVTNVANMNILGANWLFALINIFGDFTGNVSFGRPDLWVGGRAAVSGNPTNGSMVDYIYTITNKGDATATNVSLRDIFKPNFIEFVSSSNGARIEGDAIVWDIGSLAPGATIEVGYRGKVRNVPHGETTLTNRVTVSAHEPDENTSDNSETVSVVVRVSPPSSSRPSQFLDVRLPATLTESAPVIRVERRNSSSGGTVRLGDKVTHTLVVTNAGKESVYDVVLTDDLRGPSGEVIHTERYELGEVLPNEEITIEYTVLFNESFQYGIYWSSATVTAVSRSGAQFVSNPVISVVNFVQSVLTPTIPAVTTSVDEAGETNAPPVNLPQLAPIAHAAPPAHEGLVSNQAAAVGLLGLDLYHYALLILLLLLAYEAARRHREYLYNVSKK